MMDGKILLSRKDLLGIAVFINSTSQSQRMISTQMVLKQAPLQSNQKHPLTTLMENCILSQRTQMGM
jgi:hypothetical protein